LRREAPETPAGPGESPSRRSRLAVLIAATILALGLAEVGLRIFSPQLAKLRTLVELTGDERGFAPKASARIDFDGVFEPLAHPIVWQTNSAGFRDDHEVGAPGDRFRVATYGDSETFGWSVALEETFQRRMEAIDPRVEVLNFGVPGYQVINVRKQLEQTLPRFQPDLAIYLVHKNDFNEPPQLTPLSHSHLLLHVHFLWHFTIGKKIRLAIRDRPEHLEMFASEVDRMTQALEARDIPFVLAFLRWRNRAIVSDYVPRGSPERFRREYVDVQSVIEDEAKIDDHYTASAHRKIAGLLCEVISGAAEGSCIPPAWSRDAISLQASLPSR
jgi:hypothetical protein